MENEKLTGLWEKKSKNGNVYYSGKLKSGKILTIFRNNKRNSNDPEFNAFLYNPPQQQAQPQPQQQPVPGLDRSSPPLAVNDDDVPF